MYIVRQVQSEGMIIHRLEINISTMFFTICIHVLHVYNMSVFRHIQLQSIPSYDINVSSDLQVCCTLKLLEYIFFFYYVAAVVAF